MKKIFSTLLVMACFFYLANCLAAEEIQVLVSDNTAKLTYQVIDDSRLLVSAKDTKNNPIKGLNVEDFVVQRGIKKAKIKSVEPLETSEFVPLNIVLVIDNSFSMKHGAHCSIGEDRCIGRKPALEKVSFAHRRNLCYPPTFPSRQQVALTGSCQRCSILLWDGGR